MDNKNNYTNLEIDKFWTIPNIISIVRMLLIIPIVNQLRDNTLESNFNAFILISLAYATDFLDGFFARVLKSISKIGQILDPIGDKLIAITISAVLYMEKALPFYFFILIIIRDLIISLGAIYAMSNRKVILLPIFWGKLTTFLLGILLSLYPLKNSFIKNNLYLYKILSVIIQYGTYICSILLFISGLFYIINYYKNFLTQKNINTCKN